jgi:2,3-bisphosphoglycerate-dependent phosphoglycerate mutase
MTKPIDRSLVLVRHGQSEGNLKNIFTGWNDLGLTEQGIAEARGVGQRLQTLGVGFDVAFTSTLRRAWQSCSIILKVMGQSNVPEFRNPALNERNYRDLTGLNKDEARTRWGEAQVHLWRRAYDMPPPGGESLKDTSARVLPFFIQAILPRVMRGERTLVVAHGNSLRSLVMVLDRLSPEAVTSVEFATGDIHLYRLAADTTVERKQVSLAEAKFLSKPTDGGVQGSSAKEF